jgi:hypothetical protein
MRPRPALAKRYEPAAGRWQQACGAALAAAALHALLWIVASRAGPGAAAPAEAPGRPSAVQGRWVITLPPLRPVDPRDSPAPTATTPERSGEPRSLRRPAPGNAGASTAATRAPPTPSVDAGHVDLQGRADPDGRPPPTARGPAASPVDPVAPQGTRAGLPSPLGTPAASRNEASPRDEPSTPALQLDAATQARAVRDALRTPGAAQHAAEAGAALRGDSPAQAFSRSVEEAAHGDCAKGEYAGSGYGLLSLPFLAAAYLQERCRR